VAELSLLYGEIVVYWGVLESKRRGKWVNRGVRDSEIENQRT
jgi:hypothetical protein